MQYIHFQSENKQLHTFGSEKDFNSFTSSTCNLSTRGKRVERVKVTHSSLFLAYKSKAEKFWSPFASVRLIRVFATALRFVLL